MDRRLEDKLAMLAFGELSEGEAAEVRLIATGDPEARKMLAAYEAMRSELRGLRDVPADQLSKERMQAAILGQGLKPQKQGSWLGWIWAPAATLVVAFALTSFLRQPVQQNPVIVGQFDATDELVRTPLPLHERVAMNPLSAPRERTEVDMAGDRATMIVADRSDARSIDPVDRGALEGASRLGFRVPSMEDSASESESGMAKLPASEGPIILIRGEVDASTGAQRAIETESYANVVVAS